MSGTACVEWLCETGLCGTGLCGTGSLTRSPGAARCFWLGTRKHSSPAATDEKRSRVPFGTRVTTRHHSIIRGLMLRRSSLTALFGMLLLITAACSNKKAVNPLANVGSKQPDKVLFDKAMDAMKHNRFDVARMTLQTLINTYPDSEFIARAKLAVGDSDRSLQPRQELTSNSCPSN